MIEGDKELDVWLVDIYGQWGDGGFEGGIGDCFGGGTG